MWSLRDSECVSQTVKQADGQTGRQTVGRDRQTDVQVGREASIRQADRQTDIVKETDSQQETVNKSNK